MCDADETIAPQQHGNIGLEQSSVILSLAEIPSSLLRNFQHLQIFEVSTSLVHFFLRAQKSFWNGSYSFGSVVIGQRGMALN